jgi:MinD-like ATPase involved in chromosome partitioning or flagellar assembly
MGLTIGVTGASGGVGASSLTAAIAERARDVLADCRSSVAVDLDPRGGLDTTLCLEHETGLRWPDVELLDRQPSGGPTRPATWELPGDPRMRVLAGTGGSHPDPTVVVETLERLAAGYDLVAVDCGPRPDAGILTRVDVLVVVSRLDSRAVADAVALAHACPLALTHAVLVSRGAKDASGATALARRLGVPLLGHLPDDPVVHRHADAGLAPGQRPSRLDGVVDRALTTVETVWLRRLIQGAETPEGSR